MKTTIISKSLKTLFIVLITITLPFGCTHEKQEDLEDIMYKKKKSEIIALINPDDFKNLQIAISQFGRDIRKNYRNLSKNEKEVFRNHLTATTTVDCTVNADSMLEVASSILKVDLKPYLININNLAYSIRAQIEEKNLSIEDVQDELSKQLLSFAKPGNLKKSGIEYDPHCMEGCIYGLALGSLTCATIGLPYIPACLAILSLWYSNCVIGCEI